MLCSTCGSVCGTPEKSVKRVVCSERCREVWLNIFAPGLSWVPTEDVPVVLGRFTKSAE